MTKLPLVFSYNYSKFPFVISQDWQELEIKKASVELREDLEAWAVFMHEVFDHETAFGDEASWQRAVEEYRRLCELLDSAGVDFERDEWWNQKPKNS